MEVETTSNFITQVNGIQKLKYFFICLKEETSQILLLRAGSLESFLIGFNLMIREEKNKSLLSSNYIIEWLVVGICVDCRLLLWTKGESWDKITIILLRSPARLISSSQVLNLFRAAQYSDSSFDFPVIVIVPLKWENERQILIAGATVNITTTMIKYNLQHACSYFILIFTSR